MTEKKAYRKSDDIEAKIRLARLLYRYVGSKEACELAGLPSDNSMRIRIRDARYSRDKNKLHLDSEPISHVTLIADGWEWSDATQRYKKGGSELLILGVNIVHELGGDPDSGVEYSSSGINRPFTIGELKEALKSLT